MLPLERQPPPLLRQTAVRWTGWLVRCTSLGARGDVVRRFSLRGPDVVEGGVPTNVPVAGDRESESSHR